MLRVDVYSVNRLRRVLTVMSVVTPRGCDGLIGTVVSVFSVVWLFRRSLSSRESQCCLL